MKKDSLSVVLISNYFNHHQLPLCDELDKLTAHNFYFIATSEMRIDRKALGYGELKTPDYVVNYNMSEFVNAECDKYINDADVVIIGSADDKMIKSRIRSGKLIFRYTERPLKHGAEPLKYLPRLVRWNMRNPKGKPIYLLCASGYAALDYKKFGLFKGRTYKWGYFPEFRSYNVEEIMKEKNPRKILWCGRFLNWKHPDDAISVAQRLFNDGYSFTLDFVGTGEIELKLKSKVEDIGLQECIRFLGAMNPSEVREHMESAGIYLFTSDHQEGWGAVLNESMNSGCAVIASHMIGAVPFLIKDNVNGMVYESGNLDMLYAKIKFLLDNPSEQIRLGKEAYNTINNEWCASIAATRFVELAQSLINNESIRFSEGPCSTAPDKIDLINAIG